MGERALLISSSSFLPSHKIIFRIDQQIAEVSLTGYKSDTIGSVQFWENAGTPWKLWSKSQLEFPPLTHKHVQAAHLSWFTAGPNAEGKPYYGEEVKVKGKLSNKQGAKWARMPSRACPPQPQPARSRGAAATGGGLDEAYRPRCTGLRHAVSQAGHLYLKEPE